MKNMIAEHIPRSNIAFMSPDDRFRAIELWIRKLIAALDRGEHNRRYAKKALSFLPIQTVNLTNELTLYVEEIMEDE